MNVGLRIAVGIVVLGGLGTFAALVLDAEDASGGNGKVVGDAGLNGSGNGSVGASARDGGAAPARAWHSSRQCAECHQDVFDEWQGTHHQIAFLNPEVRKLSDDFRNKECQACHLPRPVFEVGLGNRTLPRITRPDEGVDCLTCHLGPDGGILGRHDAPAAACAPRRHEAFDGVQLCKSCHNQHQTTDQFEASRYSAEGMNCNDCHMPEVERNLASGASRKGRSHSFHGAHHTETLRSAGLFDVRVDGREVVLALENSGAGHNFPTEERHRAVDMLVRFVAQDGTVGEWQLAYRFRQPYRDEPGENTQLPAGQRKEARVEIPPRTSKVQARLWYRLNPFASDADPASTLLAERELVLP